MSDHRDQREEQTGRGEPQPELRHPQVDYDRTDLSAKGIIGFLIGLAVTVLLIGVISWGMYYFFSGGRIYPQPSAAETATPASSIPKGNPELRFPAPTLQPDPAAELNKFRSGEEERLNSYGWVDQKAGVVHIPIERAIDLVAQRGLPTRPEPVLAQEATFGSGRPTPAGAGGGYEPRTDHSPLQPAFGRR